MPSPTPRMIRQASLETTVCRRVNTNMPALRGASLAADVGVDRVGPRGRRKRARGSCDMLAKASERQREIARDGAVLALRCADAEVDRLAGLARHIERAEDPVPN